MPKLGTTATVLGAILVLAVAALAGALIAGSVTDEDPATTSIGTPSPAAIGDPDRGDDPPVPGGRLQRVADAAVAAVGGGTVVEIDHSDDPGETWEVEVITRRGEVDVALDAKLRRIPNAAYED